MGAKINVWPVLTDHIDTLVSYDSGQRTRISARDMGVQYLLPVLAGTACAFTFGSLISIDTLLTCAAVLTGSSLALAAFAFYTRTNMSGPKGSRRLRLFDEFFSNVLYAGVGGIVWTFVLMALAAVDVSGIWARVANGLVAAIGLHYLVVMAMCIKRFRAVYRDATK